MEFVLFAYCMLWLLSLTSALVDEVEPKETTGPRSIDCTPKEEHYLLVAHTDAQRTIEQVLYVERTGLGIGKLSSYDVARLWHRCFGNVNAKESQFISSKH